MAALASLRKPLKREIELDFIRGIAILAVLDFHSRGILFYPFTRLGYPNIGWMGVNIFFVLSGFLVGGLLVKEWKVRGRIDSKRFLIRRGFKIWPQYYVFLLLMLITRHRTLHQLWGNLLNVQNYVGSGGHTWSLAVEEHAYLLLVLILAIAARRNTRMRNLFLFLAALSVATIISAFVSAYYGHDPYEFTHTRIDGIFYGVMLAILYHYVPETFHRLQRMYWLWGFIIITTLTYLSFNHTAWWASPLGTELSNGMSVALLMLLYRHREGKRHSLLYRAIAWIGLYSYGIYLWHVAVVSYGASWGRYLPHWAVPTWEWVGLPMLGILLGVAFTKLVEFPALRLRDRLFPRRVDSAVGIPAELEEHSKVVPAV